MTTTTAPTTTLIEGPATSRLIPDGWRLTHLRQGLTRDGVSFSAKVHDRTGLIGTLEQTGRGGATMFFADTPTGRLAFADAVAALRTHPTYTGFMPDEDLLNGLFDEFDALRFLTGAAGSGDQVIVSKTGPEGWVEMTSVTANGRTPAQVARAHFGDQGQHWNGCAWVAA